MNDPTFPLSGLSPVPGKSIIASFDGGLLSSDGGVVLLREIEQRLRVAERLARCSRDPRNPNLVTHRLADIVRFRLLVIGAGYEDGNDASGLRGDPIFKMAQGLAPSERALASQSTISRFENLLDARALLRMVRALVHLYCESFKRVPERITLDIDDTFDAVRGGQQLRLFNAHHDEYGFQPIVVFNGSGRFVSAMLRPAKRPSGKEAALPAPPAVWHPRQLAQDENSAALRQCWSRVERVIARTEAGPTASTRASSSPISRPAAPAVATKMSTADAARPRTV